MGRILMTFSEERKRQGAKEGREEENDGGGHLPKGSFLEGLVEHFI